jgi:hypothetical protein
MGSSLQRKARMRHWAALLFLVLLAFGAAQTVRADAGEGLQSRTNLGGNVLECRDFRGQTVRSIRMDDLGDVAHARIINRMPIITLNPQRLDSLPVKLQIFFFNHECAHHLLGHVFYPTDQSENEADCWSIKFGRDSGLYARDDIAGFAPHFAKSPGSPFGHLPGPKRAERLLACFDDPSAENLAAPAGFDPGPDSRIARSP